MMARPLWMDDFRPIPLEFGEQAGVHAKKCSEVGAN